MGQGGSQRGGREACTSWYQPPWAGTGKPGGAPPVGHHKPAMIRNVAPDSASGNPELPRTKGTSGGPHHEPPSRSSPDELQGLVALVDPEVVESSLGSPMLETKG